MILFELLIGFLKIGLFSFGGGYGAIPLIREVVLSYNWIGEESLSYMIAVSESTPGPIMVNMATYIGSTKAGVPGAVIATAAVILPAFIIVILLTVLFRNLIKQRVVQFMLGGLTACVTGVILATGVYMVFADCFGSISNLSFNLIPLILTVILGVIYFGSKKIVKNGISPILLILIAAVAGVVAFGV